MSGCDNCGVAVDREPSVLCDECSEPGPRITPAMVRRLHAALDRAHRRNGGCDCMTTYRVIEGWAARENKRANGGGQ